MNQCTSAVSHTIMHYKVIIVTSITIHHQVVWAVKGIRVLVTSIHNMLSH